MPNLQNSTTPNSVDLYRAVKTDFSKKNNSTVVKKTEVVISL